MGRDREAPGTATSARPRRARAPRGADPRPQAAAPKVVGGSTITQQLAKNLFLSGERTLPRKAQEFVITWMLEALLGKQRILEIYLNNVEWGEGVFGAQAAARHYFRVDAGASRPWAGGAAGGDAAGAQALREATPARPTSAAARRRSSARMGAVDLPP